MHNLQKIILSLTALMAIMFGQCPFWIDPDIVIDSAKLYQAISVATRRSNGEIYVAVSGKFFEDTTRCGIKIFRSFDGMNWSQYLWFSITQGHLYNPSMTIFNAQDSEYLFVAFEVRDTVAWEYNVRALRHNLVSHTDRWLNIATTTHLSERDPDICDNNLLALNNPLLFCAYQSGDSICFVRSTDYGNTWSQRVIIGSPGGSFNSCWNPDCDFGLLSTNDSTFIGVVWKVVASGGAQEIRFRLNTYNGLAAHWRPVQSFIAPPNHVDYNPRLRMAFGYPSAVITFVRRDTVGTDDADLYAGVTTNAGNTWTPLLLYDATLLVSDVPNALAVDDTLGYYHLVNYYDNGHLGYRYARYDSIQEWSAPTYFSHATNLSYFLHPEAGVRNGEPYVCWVEWHNPVNKLKFDANWLQTAIRENKSASVPNSVVVFPNPAKGAFTVHCSVNNPGRVRIALYDALGRLVRNVLECAMVAGQHQTKIETKTIPAGIYFVVIDTPDRTWKKWVIIMK